LIGLDALLREWALKSATQPLSRPVPGESPVHYLGEVGYRKPGRRLAWRRCVLWLSGQDRFKLERFPPGAKRLLWIYFGENQIGDALMDLAPRSLLADFGFEVDLFTSPEIAALFEGDPWFRRVGAGATQFDPAGYDCAIVLSNKDRPLRPKRQGFAQLPWVSLHEFFTGPNFHRGLFAAQRLADLTGQALSADELQRHGLQKLRPVVSADRHDDAPPCRITLVAGGAHADRTYERWEAVIRELAAAGETRVALAGSANGREQAAALVRGLTGVARVDDLTGRMSLAQVRALLDASQVVACPDGGLMHLALTTRAALVPLFSAQIAPEWRLPARTAYTALRSPTRRISDIAPHEVAAMILRSLRATRT
jgi:hypothetical protein